MTEYLTDYMNKTEKRLNECGSLNEIRTIMSEHKDKIAFMQHERIVHFLVTMMFAVILSIFVCALIFSGDFALLLLVTIILVLLAFYIKHYYFLENTVQKMYKVYDRILEKEKYFQNKEDKQ